MQFSQRDLAERYDKDISTISRWRQQELLPPPVTIGRRNFMWEAEDILAWESLGQPNATTQEVERNLRALADDLDILAASEHIHPALRKLAGTAATSLRVPEIHIKTRLALGGVYVGTDWFRELGKDSPEELRVLRGQLRILGIIRDATN